MTNHQNQFNSAPEKRCVKRAIDWYRESTASRSSIKSNSNREDDPTHILRLIGQVITVSLETQQIIAALPSLNLGGVQS